MIITDPFKSSLCTISNSSWVISNGGYAYSSNHSNSSWSNLYVTLYFPHGGYFEYSWNVSSERNYDFINIWHGSDRVLRTSGYSSGNRKWEVGPGTHTIRFAYSKDGSVNSGSDRAAISNFKIFRPSEEITNVSYMPAAIHKDDVTVSGTIGIAEDMITVSTRLSYRILVNGVQVFPDSDFFELDSYTYNFTHTLHWSNFDIGNNAISIEVANEEYPGYPIEYGISIERLNDPPEILVEVSSDTIHDENLILYAEITDREFDEIQYNISVRNKDNESTKMIYPTTSNWTGFEFTPAYINYVIKNEDLSFGSNVLIITAQDKEGDVATLEVTVEKYNNLPMVVEGEVKGKTLYAVIDDSDGDFIQYRLLVNGEKVYPLDDWSKAVKPPFNIEYTFNREDIDMRNMNTIGIELVDSLGGNTLWKQSVLIDYIGILFTDKDESLYSTDVGEVIKYLDLGTLVAGDNSEIHQVWVKNNTGFRIDNLELYVDQKELDQLDEPVFISRTDEPFVDKKSISFHDALEHKGKLSFFVRLETTRNAVGGGEFNIWVSGDPAM